MRCPFCFERNYVDKHAYMSKEKIDAIYDFYAFCNETYGMDTSSFTLRITGGEPLNKPRHSRLSKLYSNKMAKLTYIVVYKCYEFAKVLRTTSLWKLGVRYFFGWLRAYAYWYAQPNRIGM